MCFFEVIHQSSKSQARVGKIHTQHGTIITPAFVPVATNGVLKGVDMVGGISIPIPLLFCNTYHLLLHPTSKIVAQAGGLHTFMQRTGPIITDSGGFQVFSLAYGGVHAELKSKGNKKNEGAVLKIDEEGVTFRSYRDGQIVLLTPESSIIAQKQLGADIIIPLDELPPYHIGKIDLKKSLDRTHRWEKRSLDEHLKNKTYQSIYAVIHGGIDPELRAMSAQFLGSLPFQGMAIGGSLGKNRQEMHDMLIKLMPHIDKKFPVHLLGIGDLDSIEQNIPLGIDTFDSSYPTKAARHGTILTEQGSIKIFRTEYKNSFVPLDHHCQCMVCISYTRSYIHHLFKMHETSGTVLATIHNLYFMAKYMERQQELILNNQI